MAMETKFLIIISGFILTVTALIYSPMITPAYQGVPPELVDDSLYYYSRMEEVARGKLFIGNPFFIEHANKPAIAFFGADWLASLPLFLGLPITQTIIFNFIFWSFITCFMVYLIIKLTTSSVKRAAWGTLFSYLIVFRFILRPTVMQTVYPFFLLFLIALALFLKLPQSKKRLLLVAVSVGLSFYIYSYLFQLTVAVLAVFIVISLLSKNYCRVKSLAIALAGGIFISLPLIFYTFFQMSTPNYWETLERIGLVSSRLPSLAAFYWAIPLLSILLIARSKFLIASALGIIAVLFSNVITGKELETANHVSRFTLLFLPIAIFSLKPEKFFQTLAVFVVTVFLLKDLYGGLPQLFPKKNTNPANIQEFANPLAWLENNEPKPKVVWANGEINNYVTVLTKHYVLYSFAGGLHLISNKELEERYLVANYFNNLSLENIKNDYRSFSGAGNSIHKPGFYNYRVKICKILSLPLGSLNCGDLVTPVSYRGENYFNNLFKNYRENIVPDISAELKKYQVSYVLIDKKCNPWEINKIPGTLKVYEDPRFSIYSLKYD